MFSNTTPTRLALPAAVLATALSTGAAAAPVQVQVTVENLAPANSIAFAPLHLGFNSGVFDAFDIGQAAGAEIATLAESGSNALWTPAFLAADPSATVGTIPPAGIIGGETSFGTFMVDPGVNQYFTFAAMVVPSNDFFIGNDDPTQYKLFDGAGNLQISSITLTSKDIWDAGSEIYDPSAAAFVTIGNPGDRVDQNSVVAHNFAEFYGYNGLTTARGYVFDSQLAASTPVYRISFAVAPVPEPETYAMFLAGLGVVSLALRRCGLRQDKGPLG